jgi:hypothetical protein
VGKDTSDCDDRKTSGMSTPATSPFDVIVVTSPDDLSALAARELISSSFGLAALTSPSDDSCDKYRFNEL